MTNIKHVLCIRLRYNGEIKHHSYSTKVCKHIYILQHFKCTYQTTLIIDQEVTAQISTSILMIDNVTQMILHDIQGVLKLLEQTFTVDNTCQNKLFFLNHSRNNISE